jgi:hypothetical protein
MNSSCVRGALCARTQSSAIPLSDETGCVVADRQAVSLLTHTANRPSSQVRRAPGGAARPCRRGTRWTGLGRWRGGLTTNLHLAVKQRQNPLAIVITAGQLGRLPRTQPR